MTPEEIANIRLLTADGREELSRADGKASLLLAAVGVVAGALLSAVLGGSWSPFDLDSTIEWLWWLGCLAISAAICSLGFAVYPRTARRGADPGVIAYFADVVSTPDSQLETRLKDPQADTGAVALDQLKHISKIAQRKYRAIQFALWAIAIGALLTTVSVITSSLLS